MTTTIGYRARIRFANDTAPLARLVSDTRAQFDAIVENETFETCELRGHTVAELFLRTDNRDGQPIYVCEWCADHEDVSPYED